jgi:hypothetical protein
MAKPTKKDYRNKKWVVYYKQPELAQLQKDFAQSSCKTLSQYIRHLSLKSPFDIYRNRSFDAFVDEMILLRQEMREIGQRSFLTKENELRLVQIHEEIKDRINKLIDLCMLK